MNTYVQPRPLLVRLQAALQGLFPSAEPSLGVARDRSAQADALRDYACDFVSSDPRFAQDLFAAADRHERN